MLLFGAVAAVLPLALARATGPSESRPDLAAYVTDGPVYAVAHEPGGGTFVGGEFSHVGPASGHGLALGAVGSAEEGRPVGSSADESAGPPLPGAAEFPHVAGGDVHAVVPDEHGGWFIGGDFTSIGGEAVPRLAHIQPDGTVDGDWVPSPNDAVLALALDSTDYADRPGDWTLYAGGKFTQVAGNNPRNFLAAWRVDGANGAPDVPNPEAENPDPSDEPLSWRAGPTLAQGGNVVRALAVSAVDYDVTVTSGDPPTPQTTRTRTAAVIAGGDFTALGSDVTPPTLHRIGAVWGEGALKPSDGSSIQGQALAWNPNAGTPAGSRVNAITVGEVENPAGTHDSLPVYFGGFFASGGKSNLAASRLRIENATGAVTAGGGHYSGWTPSPDGAVNSLALTGSTLYVGGAFSTIGQPAPPEPLPRLAAVAAVPSGPTGTVAVNTCNPVSCPATPMAWKPGPDAEVSALDTSADGAVVYAGGGFTQIGDAGLLDGRRSRNGMAALSAAGEAAGGVALGWDARPAGGAVNALALAGDALYAGGGFFSILAEERANLAALDADGALVEDFTTGTGCSPAPCSDGVHALALAPDATALYVGGAFTEVDQDGAGPVPPEPGAHLAALDLDPSADDPNTTAVEPTEPLGGLLPQWEGNPDADSWVLTLDVAGERLYAGGAFDHVGSAARSRIAAIDRETGAVLGWAPDARRVGPGGAEAVNVYDIEASCETVYAGGSFNRIGIPVEGSQPVRNSIAELDPGTAEASDWDPDGAGVVRALAVSETGVEGGGGSGEPLVYAGGSFAVIGNEDVPQGRAVRHGVAALRSADASVTGWNPDADAAVRALALSGDGETVYAAGSFNTIGGQARSGLAALEADGVGGGSGDATAWNPFLFNPDPAATSAVRSIDAAAANVYIGGEQTDAGAYSHQGYAQFTGGESEEPVEPLTCESSAPAPDTSPPEVDAASADAGRALLLTLSEPAVVHIDLTGTGAGLRLLSAPGCVADTRESRRRLLRQLRKRLAESRSKQRPKSRAKKARKIRRQLAKRKCSLALPSRAIEADLDEGETRVPLIEAGPLRPGTYRAMIGATDEAGNAAAPIQIDFQVAQ